MASYPYQSSSSSSSPVSPSTNQNAYGYYSNNERDVYLPPFFASPSHLQEMNDISDGKEINVHDVMAGPKVSRYSPEEKKERIERYRSKRNQRNFQKKITYECRKTLADNRPRVKGRFARNDGTESEIENAEGSYGNYIHDSSGASGAENARWQMEGELVADPEAENYYDEELWANLVDDFSVNI